MSSEESIEFATYLVERLKQCGVKYIFGVPGDYNLEFLDYIEKDEDLVWVGNANELNAAYAADGYSRITGGLGVVVTTFGVGELSALNGIAGALAERVPLLHIVGAPSTKLQASQALLHHTLNLPTSFSTFNKMSEPLSVSQAILSSVPPVTPTTWTEAFDHVLKDVLEQCRPGYVEIPTDAVHHKVSISGLSAPPPHPHSAPPPEDISPEPSSNTSLLHSTIAQASPDEAASEQDQLVSHIVDEITSRYAAASKPIIIVDACCGRFGMSLEVRKLVNECGIRYFVTPMGKSMLDEQGPLYGGCYAGDNSLKAVKEEVEACDFALYVGALKSDFNSGSFSVGIDPKVVVELHSFTTHVGFATFPATDLRHIVPRLRPAFKAAKAESAGTAIQQTLEEKIKAGNVDALVEKPEGKDIKHAWLWPRMGAWFEDTDIVITETGTSSFGLTNVPLPSHSTYVSQVLWGSIGWAVGAALGCALAAKQENKDRRTILFEGDGSLQLTVQEVGTMLRRGLHPYLFVLNNDGYEIERQIHGPEAEYNNIQMYDHQLLLPFLAGKKAKIPTPYESFEVHTPEELSDLLNDPAFNVPDKLRLIEIYMPRGDAPASLIKQSKLTAEANARI